MYDRWMLPLSVPSLSLIHWFPFIFSYHHFNLSSLSFSFLSFFLCSKLVLLFLLQDHRLCYLRSHQGVKLVDGKLINSGIPDCSTHLWCVCVYVCVRAHLIKQPCFSDQKKKTSNLEAYVRWFNRLCYLVATEICMVSGKHNSVSAILKPPKH